MTKSVTEWLREGENLMSAGLAEYRELDERINALDRLRAEKWEELNTMARLLGRPASGEAPQGAAAARAAPVAAALNGRK